MTFGMKFGRTQDNQQGDTGRALPEPCLAVSQVAGMVSLVYPHCGTIATNWHEISAMKFGRTHRTISRRDWLPEPCPQCRSVMVSLVYSTLWHTKTNWVCMRFGMKPGRTQ
jgi:hypothetical protein